MVILMESNFDDFYYLDCDYSTVRAAWNAGATAMFERLVDLGYVDPNYKPIAWKDVKGILESNNG